MMLCKLSDVKTLLKIAADDTSQDDRLNLMIKGVSAEIESYIGYKLEYGTYTEELHNVNSRQLIQLNHFPIREVTSVTINDKAVEDFKIIPEYARWGRLYKGNGWNGGIYTRGFTHDVVSGVWEIKVTYTAGYKTPGDSDYTEDGEYALPYDIVTACINQVVMNYNYDSMGATGLKSHHEGNISDTFGDAATEGGLSAGVKKLIDSYVWYGVA